MDYVTDYVESAQKRKSEGQKLLEAYIRYLFNVNRAERISADVLVNRLDSIANDIDLDPSDVSAALLSSCTIGTAIKGETSWRYFRLK